jgi:hypothetical protein
MLSLILLVFALVLSICAAIGWPGTAPNYRAPHLGWLAIAFWIASELFGRAGPYLGMH